MANFTRRFITVTAADLSVQAETREEAEHLMASMSDDELDMLRTTNGPTYHTQWFIDGIPVREQRVIIEEEQKTPA